MDGVPNQSDPFLSALFICMQRANPKDLKHDLRHCDLSENAQTRLRLFTLKATFV
jgi:hypothetical protein